MPDDFDLDAVRARQAAARQAAATEYEPNIGRLAIDRCRLCDDDGYRGATVCDHVEHSTPEGRAAAKAIVRAALAKGDTR